MAASAPVHSLGALLRERREAMGVTLAEVEVATRIRQKYLSALESDEWHLLPGEVVGRGFLRNYADYLGLEPQEVMDRRRALTDPNMNTALSSTSAGAPLPPERQVDYRPKEVELKDEGDGIQRSEIRLTPILAIIALAAVVALGIWGLTTLREPLAGLLQGGQTRVAGLFDRPEPTATSPAIVGIVNEQNLNPSALTTTTAGSDVPVVAEPTGIIPLGSGGADTNNPDANNIAQNNGAIDGAAIDNSGGDNTGGDSAGTSTDGQQPAGDQGGLLVPTPTPAQPEQAADASADPPAEPTPEPVVPTDTPLPEPPTPTPEPPTPEPPTPTPEPIVPTDTPPPPVAAAACGDGRSVISSPGAGQVIGGVTGVTGNATHESFQYFKLEYAPGANAGDGFVYFAGSNVPIAGGLLGNLDTTTLPNGDYTLRLTVVDQSGNFPPPCDVSVVIQN